MPSLLPSLLEGLLSLLFPPRCEVCGALQEPVVCARCAGAFRPIVPPMCRQCGLPFDPPAHPDPHCAECRSDPPLFDAGRAAGYYEGPLRRAIHVFKYGGTPALAAPLGDFMARVIEPPFPVEVLCPVPLHEKRLKRRGYNQSRLLAERLGAAWNLPVEDLLARNRNTVPQVELPADARRGNVRGAFAAIGGPPSPAAMNPNGIRGRAIGLVDDVYTTGATLRECSLILKRAGAARVLVLTIVRAAADPGRV